MSTSILSEADSLRLNVLLRQPLQALRIDDGRMVVHALSDRGELSVTLHPDCRDELYLRRVRELLSSHYLGSPGGYPVFLRRWTRMGQARAGSLGKLLLLGEEEAAVAVVHSPDLDAELARRVWWAYPSAENARRMLEREAVAGSPLGRELAAYLLDYLPFETEHQAMIDSVRLMLRPGLLPDADIHKLWRQGQRRNSYLVGFLAADPRRLPCEGLMPHPDLASLPAAPGRFATPLRELLSLPGQAFLTALAQVLRKPADQDVVVAVFEVLEAYFSSLRDEPASSRSAEQLAQAVAQAMASAREEGDPVAQSHPQLLAAMLTLAHSGEQLVAPILGRTDAVGTVLRNKLQPVTEPIWGALQRLLVQASGRA